MCFKKKISLILILTLVLSQIAFPMIGIAEGPGDGPGEGEEPPSRWDPANTKIISTTPSITPLFEMTSDGDRGPAGFYSAGFNAEGVSLDTSVEIKISADEKPFMLMNMGDLQSWSYDATSKIVTVNTKPIDFYHIDEFNGEEFHMPSFIVVGFGPNPGGDGGKDQGPPDEAEGMWMSTNASQWEMRPSEDGDGDGMPSSMVLKLTGKAGKAGFFKMFWPTALLKKMGLTKDTLAGFINGNQISSSTEAADGGVIVTFRLTYSSSGLPEPKIIKSAATPGGFKTVTVATGKASSITIALNKKKVKKGKKVLVSGYANPRRGNIDIYLYKKEKGESGYELVGHTKTKSSGRYKFSRKVTKTSYFKTARKKSGKLVYSKSKKVTVK